ncbi:competence protein CoiA family protein [Collimonas sp. H4R21]|uniref:Competence protein CoiA family protein n=1 Tax=Collimonas rhizosphaerae TaxID=3126357 RepID=A0ABU9PRM3_9BURK
MQYSLVDNQRREAFTGGKGICPTCGSAMVAKCGPRVIHHWAHATRQNCDPWWENETAWHRDWKNLFPENCREISHTAPDGEIHRADIKTSTGIIIEVQHSAMTDAERISRESFYGNLVWVIDGSTFRKNFDIYHLLPDPTSNFAQDLIWSKATRSMQGAARGLFFRLSEALLENPNATRATLKSGWIHGIHEIEEQVNQAYRGHHQYDWVRPRRTWLDAKCPVYIDLGDNLLARLEIYDETGLHCIRLISKRKFIHDAMTELSADAIASRFYPL